MADKVVNDQIWYMVNKKVVSIGFTESFLKQLDECWHILPANNKSFKKNNPLLTVETNDCLVSIPAPVDGFLTLFDDKAQNYPDKLTESDVIMQLITDEPPQPAQVAIPRGLGELLNNRLREAAARPFGDIGPRPMPMDWEQVRLEPVGDAREEF